MFPIRDHNPSRTVPYVTHGLIAVNVLIFLLEAPFLYGGNEQALLEFFWNWALIPVKLVETGDVTGLFTSMFLHGGLLHLAGNMLFLWVFGDNMEDALGHVGFGLFYLACGLAAGLAQVMIEPGSQLPMVGASGAIAGVLGGYLLLYPRARVDLLVVFVFFVTIVPVPAWMMLIYWFGMQLLGGLAADPAAGGVAFWAHTGGFVAGLLLTVPVWLARGARGHWRATEGRPPYRPARYPERLTRVPRVSSRRRRGPWE